jgi:hypothetical protein
MARKKKKSVYSNSVITAVENRIPAHIIIAICVMNMSVMDIYEVAKEELAKEKKRLKEERESTPEWKAKQEAKWQKMLSDGMIAHDERTMRE